MGRGQVAEALYDSLARRTSATARDVYPGWLRGILTFLVPVAFATTVPAQALIGHLQLATLLLAMGTAGGLMAVSRFVWLRGLRHYSGASA